MFLCLQHYQYKEIDSLLIACMNFWSFQFFALNPFNVIGLVQYPPKTSENQKFSDVFRGYWKGPEIWNGLTHLTLVLHYRGNHSIDFHCKSIDKFLCEWSSLVSNLSMHKNKGISFNIMTSFLFYTNPQKWICSVFFLHCAVKICSFITILCFIVMKTGQNLFVILMATHGKYILFCLLL